MKKLTLTTVLAFFCFAFLFSQEQKPEQLRLTLNDCLIKALENNLDISVEAYRPEINEFSIREYRERFIPQLSFGYTNSNNNLPTNWYVEGDLYTQKRFEYSFGLAQNIITGGRFNLSLSNSTTDTTRSLTIVNPTYSSTLFFEFNQPLLKNFGPKINRRDIKKAQNQRDISVYGLKSVIIQKVYEVENAYWNLVNAIENLKVQDYSLEHSREQLEKTREAARIGTKTAIDVLKAETEVANWESNIIYSRSQVETAEDTLRKIMNLPTDTPGLSKSIVPLDKPFVEKKEITFEEALKIALEERPDMESKQKEIENNSIDVSYFKNQLLPQLDIRFQLYFPGQSGDLLIYRNNDPYTGDVIGKMKGSKSDSMKDVFGFEYDNWVVSLNLNLPLGNFLSRASLARARMEKEQKLLEKEKLRKDIYHDILAAFKKLKNNEIRMEASSRYRELMEKKLEAEEQRYKLGIAISSDWLFSYQRELATAKRSEIQAIIEYKISVAELERILGINLKTKNLKFRNYDF